MARKDLKWHLDSTLQRIKNNQPALEAIGMGAVGYGAGNLATSAFNAVSPVDVDDSVGAAIGTTIGATIGPDLLKRALARRHGKQLGIQFNAPVEAVQATQATIPGL